MGLHRVPRAALAQRVHERDQLGHLIAGGAAVGGDGGRDVDGREVVGLQRAVELPPVDRHHHLVVEAEVVQEHRPWQLRAIVVGEGQLHLGEQVARPALGHQEGAALAPDHGPEVAGIDEAHPFGQRVDAQCRPGQVQGRRGPGRTVTSTRPSARSRSTVRSATERRPGHGVDDGVGRRLDCRRHQGLDDPGVDLVECRGRLVEVDRRRARPRSGRPPDGGPSGDRRAPVAARVSCSVASIPRRSVPAGPRPTTATWGRRRGTLSR